jgi:hypothetical protein
MWSANEANEWYASKGFIFGFNYVTSTAVNSTEMWQKETFDAACIDQELRMAAAVGYNSCRVFLPYIVWENDSDGFLARLEEFLAIAARHGLSMMPILFDDCAFAGKEPYSGPQDAPVKNVHNSGWTPSPGFLTADDPSRLGMLEAYIKEVITAHKKDSRIIAWDIYNEPGNSSRNEKSLPLLENAFKWARACEATQPLTVGIWKFKDYEYRFCELSDIISFHMYLGLERTAQVISDLRKYGRPLFCTEWLNRPLGSRFESHLPLFIKENVAAYQWGLVAGKTQTYLNWDSEKNDPKRMPDIWQHDLLNSNGTVYDSNEIDLINNLIKNHPVRIR